MTYDHWKTTNPADEWLDPEPGDDDDAPAYYYVEPRGRTYTVVDERDGRDVQHFPIARDWRAALQLAETLRDELNGVGRIAAPADKPASVDHRLGEIDDYVPF